MNLAEVQIPSDGRYVGLVRLMVTVAARLSGVTDERIEDLKIAVSEATTNAILAHARSDSGTHVMVQFGVDRGDFTISVRDAGPGFDLDYHSERMRDWTDEGGLGVFLIQDLADDTSFDRADDGMLVTMRFRLEESAHGSQKS